MRVVFVAIVSMFLLSGCIGKIVAAPFKIVGDVVETVLP